MPMPAEYANGTSPTMTLATYVAQGCYEDLPAEVVTAVKGFILDSIGNAIGGSQIAPGRIVRGYFEELGGSEDATVLASGKRLPVINAAYVNSFLANTLDFDDTYAGRGAGHPGATIVPPALAVAEQVRATGKELINAVALGYEVSLRICEAIYPTGERMRQVLGLSTWQGFGAATVASKLQNLDAEWTATAFGLAGPSASVPFGWKFGLAKEDRPYSWIKNNYGWASMGGILGAQLAARGFLGNRHFLDGGKGFWVMAGSDRCDFDVMTAGLGEEFHVLAVSHKPYACCRWSHTTLDAVAEIRARRDFDVEDIKAIRVKSFYEAVDSLGVWKPKYIVDAMFSLPHLIALTLLDRSPAKGLREADLDDPQVKAMEEKVTNLELDPEADRQYKENLHWMPSTVSIELHDGTVHSARVINAAGDPEKPLSRQDLEQKFSQLVIPVLGSQRAHRFIKEISTLEQVEDVSKILA